MNAQENSKLLDREINWNDTIDYDKREGGGVGTTSSCMVREGLLQIFSSLVDKKE